MPRLLRRHVALPTDHGAWAFLLSPLLIGLFAGGTWRIATTYLCVAALCAFLIRQPITRAIKAWSGRTSGTDLGAALLWIGIYGVVGLLHVLGLVLRGEAYVLWLAVPGVPAFAWYLWLVWHRAERRRRMVEIIGAGSLALSAPAAVWIAHGGYAPIGWALFAMTWGHTSCMIVLAYVRLEQKTWPAAPPLGERLRVSRTVRWFASAQALVVVVLFLTHVVSWPLMIPYAFQAGVVLWDSSVPAIGWRPKQIGVRLLLTTTVFTALFVLAWWLGMRGA